MITRREFLGTAASAASGACLTGAFGNELLEEVQAAQHRAGFLHTTGMVGRVTGHDAVVNLVIPEDLKEELSIRVRPASRRQDVAQPPFSSPVVRTSTPLSCVELPIVGLQPNQSYSYRIEFATASKPHRWFRPKHHGTFRSQKTTGQPFSFCVVADPHWGRTERVPPDGPRYWSGEQCLRAILADGPFDFMVDLGDSPYPVASHSATDALRHYLRYRDIMASVTRVMPVYLVLGNHEQEGGFFQKGVRKLNPNLPRNGLRPRQHHQKWCTRARLLCIPNPRGDTYPQGGEGAPGYDSLDDWLGEEGPWNEGTPRSHLQNFYAWTWSDALFVVLDPHRATLVGSTTRPNSPSQWTLGATQLQWLRDVLARSNATWKFVLCHHQVGGAPVNFGGHSIQEGGAQPAYARGSAVEAERPGTEQVLIHNLMRQHGVQFFVYGHDHVFCHSIKSGIHYLCCGRPTFLNPWWDQAGMLASYGSILEQGRDKPWIQALRHVLGYTKFTVTPRNVTMQWIRTGYSFPAEVVPVGQARRDWLESWAGRQYPVDSPSSLTLTMVPTDVDGVRTVDGAKVPGFYQPPTGTNYYKQPTPARPESHTDRTIPLADFPESDAVVDTVPDLVYEVRFDI